MLKSSIKLVDDHYELPLPWKYEDQIMPKQRSKTEIFNSNSNNVRQKLRRTCSR